MSYLTANGYPVTQNHESFIELPITGRAVAELYLAVPADDAPIAQGDSVLLEFQDGTTHAMTVTKAGAKGSAWGIECVAGKDKMATLLPARHYREVEAETLVIDIARELGEDISELKLEGFHSMYVRMRGQGFAVLDMLLEYMQVEGWRFNPDGGLRIGAEMREVTREVQVEYFSGEQDMMKLLAIPELKAGEVVRVAGQMLRPTKVVQVVGRELYTEVHL